MGSRLLEPDASSNPMAFTGRLSPPHGSSILSAWPASHQPFPACRVVARLDLSSRCRSGAGEHHVADPWHVAAIRGAARAFGKLRIAGKCHEITVFDHFRPGFERFFLVFRFRQASFLLYPQRPLFTEPFTGPTAQGIDLRCAQERVTPRL